MIYSSLILFQNLAGISGDESDASRGLPVNLEVPPGLQVVPMSKHHEHGPADFSLSTSLHHHLLPTADDVRERLKVWANHLMPRNSGNPWMSFCLSVTECGTVPSSDGETATITTRSGHPGGIGCGAQNHPQGHTVRTIRREAVTWANGSTVRLGGEWSF